MGISVFYITEKFDSSKPGAPIPVRSIPDILILPNIKIISLKSKGYIVCSMKKGGC